MVSCAGETKENDSNGKSLEADRVAMIPRLRANSLKPITGTEEIAPMQRRDFLKSTVAVAVAAELGIG